MGTERSFPLSHGKYEMIITRACIRTASEREREKRTPANKTPGKLLAVSLIGPISSSRG